jgi:hypothetical protein
VGRSGKKEETFSAPHAVNGRKDCKILDLNVAF